jgi:ABC-type transport system substrate-binding protein
MNVVPALADNMRVSADGTTYLFRLREGVRWSDGVPVTAGDFEWTWNRIRAEGATTAFLLEGTEARALDDRTLEVTLDRPRSSFPYALASTWTFPWPRHVYEAEGPDWCRSGSLVSNGPYTLAERTESHLRLLANPHYAGPRGNVREIVVSIGTPLRDQLDGWRTGRFDVLLSDLRVDALEDTETTAIPGLGLVFAGLNPSTQPLANELVRRALAHALDPARVAEALGTSSTPVVRGGAIPPAMPGHSSVGIPTSVETARALLAEAGHPGGSGLPVLRLLVHPSRRPEVFAELLAEIGVRVATTVSDGVIMPAEAATADIWVCRWLADYPDPEGLFHGLFTIGWPFLHPPEVLDALERARDALDQDARMELFREVDRVWVGEHAAIVPLLYDRWLLLRRPWLDGVWANPLWGAVLDSAVVHRPA